MRKILSIVNITNPGVEPVDGDIIKINYDDDTDLQKIFTSVSQIIPDEPIRVITVSAFQDRLNSTGKLNTIYQMIKVMTEADPPDYTLHASMENMKSREYINLDDPRLDAELAAIGIFTEEEIDDILSDGIASEEPETI